MNTKCLIGVTAWLMCQTSASAQVLRFYRNDGKHNAYRAEMLDSISFNNQNNKVELWFQNGAFYDFGQADLDSVTVNRKAQVAQMKIITEKNAPITSKEDYVRCVVTVDGKNMFPDAKSVLGNIRGRGNSTWLWYDKKPYKIKLDEKTALMGLKKGKEWVLMANYRDPTFLMNAFAFELADYLNMPIANHTRFVELTLNGQYLGLYMLTEQVTEGKNRVEVDETNGILLNVDVDDGPQESPDATNNFYSSVFRVPVAVKYPKNEALTATRLSEIKDELKAYETAMKNADYETALQLLDVKSLMDFLIVQELTYNVELYAPRSMYMYKNTAEDSVWHYGPVWDFDGGFAFDWSDMYTNRNYFISNQTLMGRDPGKSSGVSGFFVGLFKNDAFRKAFRSYWAEVFPNLQKQVFTKLENYREQIRDAMEKDRQKWHLSTVFDTELNNMENWLKDRLEMTNTNFMALAKDDTPTPSQPEETGLVEATDVNANWVVDYQVSLSASDDLYGGAEVSLSVADDIARVLGLNSKEELSTALGTLWGSGQYNASVTFLGINADGTLNNTASSTNSFGHWWDANGKVCTWGNATRVFTEMDPATFIVTVGKRPGYVQAGDKYVITEAMQKDGVRVAIRFTVTIEE